MKKNVFLSLTLSAALAVLASACASPTNGGNSASSSGNNHNSMNSSMNHNAMNHNAMNSNMTMNHGATDHGAMDHSQMKSSPNAAGAPYDLQFIDTMVAHHQGAVDMARMVESRTSRSELRAFAAKIITDQDKEIAQMKEWREKWYAGKPAAMNMEMPGMADSMKMDMSKLAAAKDKEFDVMFLEMMTPHHDGAIVMSREALQKAEHPEIKTLANQIIKAQEAEIKMMADWKSAWNK